MSKGKTAAVDTGIAKPQPLKFNGEQAVNWRSFKEEWDAYEEASGLGDSSSTERVVTFLRVVGKDAINIYNSFAWPKEADCRNIDLVIEKFETLCLSERSTRFQRYLFHKREQQVAESLEDYLDDINKLAESCNFGEVKEMLVCDKIIFGLKDPLVREEMLKNELIESEKVVEVIKEKLGFHKTKQKEKMKVIDRLKSKGKVKKGMADDIEMIQLEGDEVDYDEDGDDGTGTKKDTSTNGGGVTDELVLKADSDLEDEQDDDEQEKSSSLTDSQDPQTKRDTEFTSEDFKIELRGLPRYYAIGPLKKLLNETLQLKAHKIKPSSTSSDFAYITFRDEKSRARALVVLNEYQWKKCTLTASVAKAVDDPVGKRRKDAERADPDAGIPINERISKSVTPYATKDYQDQLKEKTKSALGVLRKFGNELAKTNPELKKWIKFHKLRRKGQICEVMDIIPSPITTGYRNKCEFTIGINPENEEQTVGFRVSSYKSGSLAVGPVEHLLHIPDSMKKVAKLFEDYVRKSEYAPFCPLTHEGVWRQLNVRTSTHDDLLIAVVIHPQEMSEEKIDEMKTSIVEYFRDGDGASAGVTSIFFQAFGQKAPGPEEIAFEHLFGETHITETVLDKKFRISCESFFQVNSMGCEVLYNTVAELMELDGTSVILDVCCGTGTIGISLADQCLKVYGIEMVKKAAEDARHNAELNGLDNVAIYTGKAEVNMNAVLAQCVKYNTVGIVDPPRAGLSESVIKSLRKCENMNRMVYMSCDPEAAFKNFIDLSRPISKNYKGELFVPIKAAIVDMFPQTPNYELIILFERWEERKWRRIMEGNPLPRDEEYFKRIPAKPEGAVEVDSEEEEEVEGTGIGSWKMVGRSNRNAGPYRPYNNPRHHQYGDGGNQGSWRGPEYGGQGLMGNPPDMGGYPYDNRYNYGGGGGGGMGDNGGQPHPSRYDSFYNQVPDRSYNNRQGGKEGMSDNWDSYRRNPRVPDTGNFGMGNMSEGFAARDRPQGDPYRISRGEYDQGYEPFSRRQGQPRGGGGVGNSFNNPYGQGYSRY